MIRLNRNKSDSHPFGAGRFDIVHAICAFLQAASLFKYQGHKDIWIYFVFGRLHFSHTFLPMPPDMFIGHYLCESVWSGLTVADRNILYYRLAVAHIVMSN